MEQEAMITERVFGFDDTDAEEMADYSLTGTVAA